MNHKCLNEHERLNEQVEEVTNTLMRVCANPVEGREVAMYLLAAACATKPYASPEEVSHRLLRVARLLESDPDLQAAHHDLPAAQKEWEEFKSWQENKPKPGMSVDERTLGELAKEALLVQDACDLSGVVHGFSRAMARLWQLRPNAGTIALNQHPIVQLWADKVASLAGTQLGEDWAPAAYAAVKELVAAELVCGQMKP
jgi:hypothetical protein